MTTPSAEAMERAQKIIALYPDDSIFHGHPMEFAIAAALDAFAAEARADQKERDARIVEKYKWITLQSKKNIAAAIREQKP